MPEKEKPRAQKFHTLGPKDAAQKRQERLAIEQALLDRDDYTYQVYYTYNGNDGRQREGSSTCPTLQQARKVAKARSGRIEKRIKKSGCRKFADFYRLCLPDNPVPQSVEYSQLGNFIFQTERGAGWIAVKAMRAQDLSVLKAEYTISVVTPEGKPYAGVGACAISDSRGFKQPTHDIVATAFTRALNRAITEAVGWGAGPADDAEQPQAPPSSESSAPPVEETPPQKEETPGPQKPKKATRRKKPAAAAPAKPPAKKQEPKPTRPKTSDPIQLTQQNTIKVLAGQIGLEDGQLAELAESQIGKPMSDLSQRDGLQLITHLVSIKNRKAKSA